MEQRTHKEVLVQVSSLDQMKTDGGRGGARLRMPYWVMLNNGTLLFEFINAQTNKEELILQIENKQIWIRKIDYELYESQRRSLEHAQDSAQPMV